jgi:hypothetical protein
MLRSDYTRRIPAVIMMVAIALGLTTQAVPNDSPLCLDASWLGFIDALMNRRAPQFSGIGIGYMLQGDVPVSTLTRAHHDSRVAASDAGALAAGHTARSR